MYPNRLIKTGERQRSVVKLIQQQLNRQGAKPALKVDGYFGPLTTQAVKWFQANNSLNGEKLKIDGIVGSKTWVILFKAG